jgi:hypothetical protein
VLAEGREHVVTIGSRDEVRWTLSGYGTGLSDRMWATNRAAAAGDGSLGVATLRNDRASFALVLTHREGSWHQVLVPAEGPALTAHAFGCVALSGRTAVFGGDLWNARSHGGRAWFVEITDEDLSRATPLPAVALPDLPEEKALRVVAEPPPR